jgi:hypothetical protein
VEDNKEIGEAFVSLQTLKDVACLALGERRREGKKGKFRRKKKQVGEKITAQGVHSYATTSRASGGMTVEKERKEKHCLFCFFRTVNDHGFSRTFMAVFSSMRRLRGN